MNRQVMLVCHPQREDARSVAAQVAARLAESGITPLALAGEGEALARLTPHVELVDDAEALDVELVCVLGGDGTILRAAELVRDTRTPLLGVNLGHVGFLAEAEREDAAFVVQHIVERDYSVEERDTLEVCAALDGEVIARSWALNEASVEKASRERMLEISLEIDGRPLSTFGCDGIICATPTGSTAYAFSAGGPVMWPGVPALAVVPISAHALFARPLVLGPQASIAIEMVNRQGSPAVLSCDGRRTFELPVGARVEVARSELPVRLARLSGAPFTDRLVRKFDLSVAGWRGRSANPVTDRS